MYSPPWMGRHTTTSPVDVTICIHPLDDCIDLDVTICIQPLEGCVSRMLCVAARRGDERRVILAYQGLGIGNGIWTLPTDKSLTRFPSADSIDLPGCDDMHTPPR